MADQGYNLKYTGKEIDDLLDKANDMDSSAQVPAGGTSGQVLTKKSGTNYDAEWKTPGSSLPSGGTPSQVLTKKSLTAGDAEWRDAPVMLPAGGNAGQILQKKSSTRNDAGWVDVPSSANPLPAGGSAGQALVKNSSTNYDVKWATIQSGGGSSGESDLFVVKVTGTSSNYFSADKTFDEMLAAYQSGKAVVMVPKDITTSGSSSKAYLRCLPLSQFYSMTSTNSSSGITTTSHYAVFSSSGMASEIGVTHSTVSKYYIRWSKISTSDGTVTESFLDGSTTMYTVPYGGKTGQILSKTDDGSTSFNMKWIDPPSGGSSGGGLTKTQLWKASNVNMNTQTNQSITLNSGLSDYILCYIVYVEKSSSIASSTQIIQTDIALLGSYTWNLKAADGSSRTVRYSSDTSLAIGNGYTSTNTLDNTACIVLGVYGVK